MNTGALKHVFLGHELNPACPVILVAMKLTLRVGLLQCRSAPLVPQFEDHAVTNPNTPDAPWGSVETRFDPIHSAARMRDAETVKREIDAGVDVDVINGRAANGDGGNTALWFAAQGPPPSGLEVARLLIMAGAQVNRKCEHGRTALQMAAAWGHLDVVQLLIENGADPSILDDEGMTPAVIALRSQRVPEANLKQVVDYLNTLDQQNAG